MNDERRHDDEAALQGLFDQTATQADPWATERIVARASARPPRGGWLRRLRAGWKLALPVLAAGLVWLVWPAGPSGEAPIQPGQFAQSAQLAEGALAVVAQPGALAVVAQPGAPAGASTLAGVAPETEVGWQLLGAADDSVLGAVEDDVLSIDGVAVWSLDDALEPAGVELALALDGAALGAAYDPLLGEPGGSLLMPLEDER
jgi:hypothetical protein